MNAVLRASVAEVDVGIGAVASIEAVVPEMPLVSDPPSLAKGDAEVLPRSVDLHQRVRGPLQDGEHRHFLGFAGYNGVRLSSGQEHDAESDE